MKSIDTTTLNRLVELDKNGFILPPGMDAVDFIQRAQETLDWAAGVKENLLSSGKTEIMGENFSREQEVPEEILTRCIAPALRCYGIAPDWAPAFFAGELLPWYVGGACFTVQDEIPAMVCFLLSNRFRQKDKWLFYERSEIIAHEICHVARSMMKQVVFEEPLAYAISSSRLRRALGPMFRGNWEASAVLGGSLIMLAGSVFRTLGGPDWLQHAASAPLLITAAFLTFRAFRANRTLKKAIEKLSLLYGGNARAVAFRCTDREIFRIASEDNTGKLIAGFILRNDDCARWNVIEEVFGNDTPGDNDK